MSDKQRLSYYGLLLFACTEFVNLKAWAFSPSTSLFLKTTVQRSAPNDDSEALSQFGTKTYWDDMYVGMGDFSSEEYSWYYGWDVIKPHFLEYVSSPKTDSKQEVIPKILVPGVGNDGMLLDLYSNGFTDLTAFDYSENAIDRQRDLLFYNSKALRDVQLEVMNAMDLDDDWTDKFDVVLEKGLLDAIYLSGSGNVEKAVEELTRVVNTKGLIISISGVVPEELRREIFNLENWEWLRDGSTDLKAGIFVLKRK